MINEMFCMQCEEAQKGDVCLKTGTCGKRAPLSARIDLLMFMIKGLAVVADTLAQHNKKVDTRTSHLITESLYASMTNVNFDDLDIERRIIACMELRYEMIQMAHIEQVPMPTPENTVADTTAPATTTTTTTTTPENTEAEVPNNAGIIVAIVAGAIVVAGIVVFFIIKKKNK